MSRRYNPVIAAYNNTKIPEKPVEDVRKFSGLLTPRNITVGSSDEDLSQPRTRMSKHVEAIRNRRRMSHGS